MWKIFVLNHILTINAVSYGEALCVRRETFYEMIDELFDGKFLTIMQIYFNSLIYKYSEPKIL